jgi:hypothetical protein
MRRIHAMNGNSGDRPAPRQRPLRRAAALGAMVTASALLATACGGGRGSPAMAADTSGQALKYSQCMRSHGLPGFPDPDSQGGLMFTPKDHLNPGSPQFQLAQRACQHLAPGGPPTSLTAAQLRQATRQGLKFVTCMRARAVPNMPDPTIQTTTSALLGGTAQSLNFDLRATGFSPDSPVLKSALQACHQLLPSAVAVSIQGAPRP